MDILNKHKKAIASLCVKHKIRELYASGSVLTSDFTNESDVDFVVEFNFLDPAFYADNYYDLKFSLEDILDRPIDLLEQQALKNPYMRQNIEAQRQLIYGS